MEKVLSWPANCRSGRSMRAAVIVLAMTVGALNASAQSIFAWPVDGAVVRTFSMSTASNPGIEIAAPIGGFIRAAASGRVAYAGNEVRDMGYVVVITHADGYITAYGRLAALSVAKGYNVQKGQIIGSMGTVGGGRPTLHFEIRRSGAALDPVTMLPSAPSVPSAPSATSGSEQASPRSPNIEQLPQAPVPDPLVVSVQTLLAALGYDPGMPDGFAGPRTSMAISAFQKSIGETPNGKPSEALRASLQKALAERGPGSAPKQPDKPRDGLKGDTKLVSTGTGFFIAGDIIITNNHVVEGCKEIRVAKRGAEIGGARSIATNRGDDLAALRADKPSENYLKLRIGVPVKAAEPVLVFGYPLSVVLSSSGNTTLGNVTALAGLKDDSRYIQISAAVQPGNSGGPVLDEAGRLVGVIEGKLDALKVARATGDIPQNVNFAIRTSTLVNFLEANRIAYEVASSSATLPNTQLAEQAEAASVQLECRK